MKLCRWRKLWLLSATELPPWGRAATLQLGLVPKPASWRSYTSSAALAAFEEKDKGSISTGKLADLVVLSRDLLAVPVDRIIDTRVLYTIVGGKVVYQGQ